MKSIPFLIIICLVLCCTNKDSNPAKSVSKYQQIGSLMQMDESLGAIIDSGSKAEIIADGYDWSEGPLWLEEQQMLIFSDVPRNTIYKWSEAEGSAAYLSPSGYTDTTSGGGETGSNGLLLDIEGQLVLCQHGNRQMARMDAPLAQPKPEFTSLANQYKGMRFNSPNDAIYASDGTLYFTDPPYGLANGVDDLSKEIPYQGVFALKPDGEVILVTDSIARPNGINFLPGESDLLVANSDSKNPCWYKIKVNNGSFGKPEIFFNVPDSLSNGPGLPDGLKVDKSGIIYATGPGGIYFLTPEAELLGLYQIPGPTSNCALSKDERSLYITNDDKILRLPLK